ncbi:hypothetical protein HPG69_007574 [Diceros bicornis minor]|uniref:Perilipin-5 n=1 Tax=Diceros bicornis minor TaxID=77932 RepID=A0A7J7EZK4_DICBM|nr:hypothetical protein HPG69_007574 [Diceros bicornis minor]
MHIRAPHDAPSTPSLYNPLCVPTCLDVSPSLIPASLSPVATVNDLACRGLDTLEEKLPFLQQPSETVAAGPDSRDQRPSCQVVTSAKDTVASGVTGAVGLARQGGRWSVELTRSVSHAVDVVLGKSEELVDPCP